MLSLGYFESKDFTWEYPWGEMTGALTSSIVSLYCLTKKNFNICDTDVKPFLTFLIRKGRVVGKLMKNGRMSFYIRALGNGRSRG